MLKDIFTWILASEWTWRAFSTLAIAAVLASYTTSCVSDGWRREAVRNGAAHYEADAKGESQFVWGPR